MGLDIGLQGRLAGRAVGDIELQDAGGTAQGLDLGLDGFGFGTASAAMQHQVITGLGQAQGDGTADATAGASDQYGVSHDGVPWEESAVSCR